MPGTAGAPASSAGAALRQAFGTLPFVVMAVAYFVCGMQLIFLSTHLPAYLEICGMDPMLGAQALGVIGGFNILGSLFFGWAGGRFSKLGLLGIRLDEGRNERGETEISGAGSAVKVLIIPTDEELGIARRTCSYQ